MEAMILCIETALGATSVALVNESGIVAEQILQEKNKAAELLHILIKDTCSIAGVAMKKINAVAVSGGPGSYTGLRIGVSAAKGICFAGNAALIHVETLQIMKEALVRQSGDKFDIYVPMIDARRQDVFSAEIDQWGNYLRQPEAFTVEKERFIEKCQQSKVVFFGDGANKFEKEINEMKGIYIKDILPFAADMKNLALKSWHNKDFQSVAYYEPHYYKAFYTH